MYVRSLIYILSVVFLCFTQSAWSIGALAIDSNKGSRYGFSYDYNTVSGAKNRALRECGRGCTVVKTFYDGCAAYAADQARGSTAYGWGTASNGQQARANALKYCRHYGGRHNQCLVRVWACNSR